MPSRDRKTRCDLELDPKEPDHPPKDSFSRNSPSKTVSKDSFCLSPKKVPLVPLGSLPGPCSSHWAAHRVCRPAPQTLHESSSLGNCVNTEGLVLSPRPVKSALEKLLFEISSAQRFSSAGHNHPHNPIFSLSFQLVSLP